MYKVLVVEDMDLTRQDIVQLIDWKKYGFELLPDARNGKIGLEYAKRYKPDIIITDIKMPVMTGLDMVEELKKQGSRAAVILLTAYEEFELAIRALQMGVQTFVLKYEIDEESLLRELNKCVEVLKNQKNIECMKQRQELFSLLKGNSDIVLNKEGPLTGMGKADFLLFRQFYPESGTDISEENLQELLEENLKEETFMVLALEEKSYVLFRKEKTYLSEVHRQEAVRKFAGNVIGLLEAVLGGPWIAVIAGKIKKNADIPVCFSGAEDMIQEHVFFQGSCILEKRENKILSEIPEVLEEKLMRIENNIVHDEYGHMEECLGEIQTLLVRSRNLVWYRKTVDRLMYLMTKKWINTESQELEEAIGEMKNRQKNMNVYEFIKAYAELTGILQDKLENQYSGKTRYMKTYVQKHYAEEISLNDLAAELGMNAIYLSQLFKREMGITFSGYLTQVRIEKAMELLRQGDYKIYEISEMVGYQTVQYFSKVFKKETGKNPKDFERCGE